jgi:complex III assembly factor LYRM7
MSAIGGYRKLLRSVSKAFQGDAHALVASRVELKKNFMQNKSVTDPRQLQEMLQGIEEVNEMLNFNIVQGKLNKDKGHFGKLHHIV